MPGSVNPGSVQQPEPVLRNQQEGERCCKKKDDERQAEAGDPRPPSTLYRHSGRASASANNSPAASRDRLANLRTLKPNPLKCHIRPHCFHRFVAGCTRCCRGAESGDRQASRGACSGEAKTMEEMIKRLEAEKAAIEAANTALQVTTDAAKADAAKAEAAREQRRRLLRLAARAAAAASARLWPKPSPRPSRRPSRPSSASSVRTRAA